MNFLTTGWRELERKVQRGGGRLRILLEQRKLTAAEIHLGELGWQQADFPPEVDRQIRVITHMERQQAAYSNQSADIQAKIEEIESQREVERKKHEEAVAVIELELKPLFQAREVARQPLAGLQQGVLRFEEAIAGLRETHAQLMAQISEAAGASIELNDRRADCEFQMEELHRAMTGLHTQIAAQTKQVATLDLQIQDVNRKITDATEAFETADRALLGEIAGQEQGKRETGRMVERLDKQKSSAYLAVGRCLADYEIAPMNQPGALQDVLTRRENILGLEQRIAESLTESSQIANGTLKAFYIFIAVFFAALVIALFALKHQRHASFGKPGGLFCENAFYTFPDDRHVRGNPLVERELGGGLDGERARGMKEMHMNGLGETDFDEGFHVHLAAHDAGLGGFAPVNFRT